MSSCLIVLLVGGGLFALLIVLAALGGGAKKSGSSASKETTEAKDEPAMDVTATKLFADYEKNEVSADEKYKGKRLRVSGTVASIDKDFMDEVVVALAGENQFMPVRLHGISKAAAGKLNKGDKVTATCVGKGRIIGSPVLEECEL